MLITEGPLQWPTLPADPPDTADPDQWAQAQATAVDHLWAYSGRQFGTRATTYRPAALCECGGLSDGIGYLTATWGWALPSLTLFGGDWRDGGTLPQVLVLPGPVANAGVTEVRIGGVVLAASAYRADGRWLIRVDGGDWPATQDLTANDGQADTWHVTYARGHDVPLAGQVAAGQLALEWLRKLRGDKSCIPWNATAVTRAGVSIARDMTSLARITNVEAADRWVESVNPSGLQQPPQVWNPDLPRGQRPYAGSGR